MNIKPRTYNEVLRYSSCMAMKNYVPELTNEKIEEMYQFLCKHPLNCIILTPEMMCYVNSAKETEYVTVLESVPTGGIMFDRVILNANKYNVISNGRINGSAGSTGGCGGCSSCSGCSSNNNNNNNNG